MMIANRLSRQLYAAKPSRTCAFKYTDTTALKYTDTTALKYTDTTVKIPSHEATPPPTGHSRSSSDHGTR